MNSFMNGSGVYRVINHDWWVPAPESLVIIFWYVDAVFLRFFPVMNLDLERYFLHLFAAFRVPDRRKGWQERSGKSFFLVYIVWWIGRRTNNDFDMVYMVWLGWCWLDTPLLTPHKADIYWKTLGSRPGICSTQPIELTSKHLPIRLNSLLTGPMIWRRTCGIFGIISDFLPSVVLAEDLCCSIYYYYMSRNSKLSLTLFFSISPFLISCLYWYEETNDSITCSKLLSLNPKGRRWHLVEWSFFWRRRPNRMIMREESLSKVYILI